MYPHDGALCTIKLSIDVWWENSLQYRKKYDACFATSIGLSATLIPNNMDQSVSFLAHSPYQSRYQSSFRLA